MTEHLVRKSPAYPPPLQSQQVMDPDDEVKVFSELFKETADDMTCNDSYKIYNLEGTPYNASHSASFSDLRDLPLPVLPQDTSPQEETVRIYRTEDTPYNFSNASSISDLTGISGHHSLSENNNSALNSPRPEPMVRHFAPSASNKLTTVHEDIVETPLIYSRSSPLGSISDDECDQVGDENGSVCSEFSRRAEESEVVSPSDLPESPGELEPPAKTFTKPHPPPVPPKPMGLLLKLQSRRSDAFVPPPTKFQDMPSAASVPPPSTPQSHDSSKTQSSPNDESEDGDDEDDDLDEDNEFFNKCLELGLRARSSVAVPKSARPELKPQCISSHIWHPNQKDNKQVAAIAEVQVNGNNSSSDSESGEEDEDGDYAFIRMYMERGLRIDTSSSEPRVRNAASPPPPPLPAKRKTVKGLPEMRGEGIGTKQQAGLVHGSRGDSGSSSRSGSRVGAGNVMPVTPLRSPAAVPSSPASFQSSDPKPSTATSPASSSSQRKPYLETDIDSIVNYEMFLKSINSTSGSGIHSSC